MTKKTKNDFGLFFIKGHRVFIDSFFVGGKITSYTKKKGG